MGATEGSSHDPEHAARGDGYSLVEVLAAIAILSLAILPMVGMFEAALRAATLGGNYDKARALANEKLEGFAPCPTEIPAAARIA